MADPKLVRYRGDSGAAATWTTISMSPVPAGRAIAGRLTVVNLPQVTVQFSVRIKRADGTFDSAGYFVNLRPGQVYSESVVLLAGEVVEVHSPTASPSVQVTLHGEESDN